MSKSDWVIPDVLEAKHLPQVYKLLAEPLPEKARQHVAASQNPKNYDMTGYKYQYVVNRLNEVVGLGHWAKAQKVLYDGFEDDRQQGRMKEVVVEVDICLGNHKDKETDGQIITFFLPIARHAGYGGCSSTSRADAYKGAVTDAFKKVAAFLGVGRQAYEQTIDDDYQAAVDGAKYAEEDASKQHVKQEVGNFAKTLSPPGAALPPADELARLCEAKRINYRAVCARYFCQGTRKDLTDEQLRDAIRQVKAGNCDDLAHDPPISPAKKEGKAEAVNEQSMMLAGVPYDVSNLTVKQIDEESAKLHQAWLEKQAGEPNLGLTRDQMVAKFYKLMTAEAPGASTDEAKRSLGSISMKMFNMGWEGDALTPQQRAELIAAVEMGRFDILTGRAK